MAEVSMRWKKCATHARFPVTVNRHHNLVIVRTADSRAMGDIEELVNEIDRPTPQVLLEMQILELAVGDTFRSIFDYSYQDGDLSPGPADGQPANPLVPSAPTATRDLIAAGNFDIEDSTFVYQFLNDTIRLRVQLLKTENELDVIATPMILASNNRPSRIFIGEERVLTTGVSSDTVTPATGATTTTVTPETEVRDIGTSLVIVPKINADRTVTLTVIQDSSSVRPASAVIPVSTADGGVEEFFVDTVNTANVQGVVVAKNNLTVAIGGLIRTSVSHVEEKVPILGDIPIIGRAFRKEVREREKSELVLLVTPRVLSVPGEGGVTEKRVREMSKHPYYEKGYNYLDEKFGRFRGEDSESEGESEGDVDDAVDDKKR